jgi:hypothetical protein
VGNITIRTIACLLTTAAIRPKRPKPRSQRPTQRHRRACLGLAACSSIYDLPLVTAPEPAKVVEGVRKAAAEEKLVGLLEMSAVREAYPLGLGGSGPYILCIRGAESATGPRRTCAVFFKNNECRHPIDVISVLARRREPASFLERSSGQLAPTRNR